MIFFEKLTSHFKYTFVMTFTMVVICFNFSFANQEQSSTLTGFYCLSAEEKKAIDDQFDIQDLVNATTDQCLFENPVNKVYLAISFLKKGLFNPSSKSIDQTYYNEFPNNDSFFNYFSSRIRTISIENCKSLTIAYVITGSKNFKKMSICADTITQLTISASSLAATLMHEARHIDADDISHFTCTQGTEKGRAGTCDKSREQKGGYHYGTEFSAKVAKFGRNFHPAIVASLRADTMTKLLNRFNKVPQLLAPQYILARDADSQQIQLIDAKLNIKPTSYKITGHITDRHQNSAFVYNDNSTGKILGFDLYNGLQNNVGTYAEWYNSLSIKPQGFDLFFGGNMYYASGALIRFSSIQYEFVTASGTVRGNFDATPYGSFTRFVQPEICSTDKNSLYIQSSSQEFYKLSYLKQALNFSKVDSCQQQLESVSRFTNNTVLTLNKDNILTARTPDTKSTDFNSKYDYLSQPFGVFDFFIK